MYLYIDEDGIKQSDKAPTEDEINKTECNLGDVIRLNPETNKFQKVTGCRDVNDNIEWVDIEDVNTTNNES